MMSWIVILLQLSVLSVAIMGTCIDSFTKLENEILSNGENIYNLTRAFYPANDHPALWVEVRYHINSIDDAESSTMRHSSILPGDDEIYYVFYWSFSSVMLFANPEFLEAVSFRFITFPPLVADIVLTPFCSNVTETNIFSLLNDITIWLKSYAVKRSSSALDGIDPTLQGYSSYKPNINVDEIIPFGIDIDIYVYIMTVAMALLVIVCQIVACTALWKCHRNLCKMLSQEQRSGDQNAKPFVKFKFKNIFWSVVICLLLGELLMGALGLCHIVSYGLHFQPKGRRLIVYIAALFVLILIVSFDLAIAIFFAKKKEEETNIGKLELPEFMKFCCCCRCSCYKEEDQGTSRCIHTQLCQFLAIFSLLFSSFILAIFTYGVTLAVLINPLRVAVMTVVTLTFVITFILVLAYTFENYDSIVENGDNSDDTLKKKICICCRTSPFIIILVLQCAFIGLFSAVYLNVILFTGPDKTGVLHQLAQLFPAALFIWFIKNEYNYAFKKQSSNDGQKTSKTENDTNKSTNGISESGVAPQSTDQ